MNKCKHKFVQQMYQTPHGGMTTYQDECAKCGCIGMLSPTPNAKGYYEIIARPMAKVLDLNEFRKRKEVQNGQDSKTKTTIGG